MKSSDNNRPVVLHLMRFNSFKRGSFERFLISIVEKAGTKYKFVFVFSAEPPSWLRRELIKRGALVDSAHLRTNWRAFRDLDRLIRSYTPDILHLHFFGLMTPFIPYLRWRYRVKVVVHIHAISSYEAGRTKLSTWFIPLRKRFCVKSVDKAISVSDFVRRRTAAAFPFLNGQLTTVYNGVDSHVCLNRKTQDIRFTLGLSKKTKIILTVAWLNEIKGVHVLIQSIPKVLKRVQREVVVIIAGDGTERSRLQALSKSLGIEQKIYFLGWCDNISQLLEQADIVVVPSVCEEAFSYFVLESMVAEKPIIASDIGGIPELLGGEPPAGLLFPPGNIESLSASVAELIEDQNYRQRLSSEARRRSHDRFHISKQIEGITQIYSASLAHTDTCPL